METSLQKWGNSQGVRIPRHVLSTLGWQGNERVEIIVDEGAILIKRIGPVPPQRKSIEELFKDYAGEHTHIPIDWGRPKGGEIW